MKRRILFLCTGNSCRSQMAEGFARALLPRDFEVLSAGTEAHGLNPRAVSAMAAVGVDISTQASKVLDPAWLEECDMVVTVCGDADEACAVLPSGTVKLHWPLPDPARLAGDEGEVERGFAAVRDEIRARVVQLAKAVDDE